MSRSWNTPSEVGSRLRAIRQARGESLTHVADRCDVSAATLSRIENGKQELAVTMLLTLCHMLRCTPHDVLGADTSEPVSVLRALDDVTRARAAFRAAADHARNMEKRLKAYARNARKTT